MRDLKVENQNLTFEELLEILWYLDRWFFLSRSSFVLFFPPMSDPSKNNI